MGTSKPLRFLVVGIPISPEILALVDKGHLVHSTDGLYDHPETYDLILGPTCARFVPGMEKFLDSFLAGARKLKYPEKKK